MATDPQYSPDELDEEIDDRLDVEIENVEKQLSNIKTPNELNFGDGLGSKLEETYEKLKKLPRDELIKLLANMKRATTKNEPEHDFEETRKSHRDHTRDLLRNKLEQMRLQRSGKRAIQKKMDEIKEPVSEPVAPALPTVHEQTESETEHSDTDTKMDSTKLAKNRKRIERRKRNKLQASLQSVA